ncbi:MAG: tetraacyldisaccharide 4'-kinase [Candidatus Cloacimonetes bacterium]|nr:tetraacyldisaccharide 4'-kinase [Candidatus Cloacimonadota bacterium]
MQKFIERHLKRISLLSLILYPFSILYYLVQIFRRKFYLRSLKYKSSLKVISVGNITAGGSGKTPFTIFLTKKLMTEGYSVAVSHRGYKGKFEQDNCLISNRDGLLPEAENAGDEALLLAEKLPGIPVITGKDRKKSLKMLAEVFPDLQIVILDDSFQHLKVQHDYDFLIFNQAGGIGNGFLLPAGILREPLSALKYADCIIYNGEGVIPMYLKKYQIKVKQGHYKTLGLFEGNNKEIQQSELTQSKLALISGIGNPQSFENTISSLKLKWKEHFRFPDHHNYSASDIEKINIQLKNQKIDYLLTTEKDYTKLRKAELNCKLLVLRIEFYLEENTFPADLF